jgi:hypothetical protein
MRIKKNLEFLIKAEIQDSFFWIEVTFCLRYMISS